MKIVEQQVTLVDSMGSDLSVVNAARVSFAKESKWESTDSSYFAHEVSQKYKTLSEKDQKLIAYLARHGHWTPFAHAFLSFRIRAPIFVARQLVKHQVGLAWNEVSRRYVDDEPEFYFPKVWRGKPVNAKQGSEGEVDAQDTKTGYLRFATKECLAVYNRLLGGGVAPEQARMVLPLNTMTEWIWSGSLMAFARVCKLRLDPHAQQETRDIARCINRAVEDLGSFEHSWTALIGEDQTWNIKA